MTPDLILLQKYRDTNGSRIVMQIGGVVYRLPSAKRAAYFCKSTAIEMGGVSQYFSEVSGPRVDLILLRITMPLERTARGKNTKSAPALKDS